MSNTIDTSHILNFHTGNAKKLPVWCKPPYRIIFGVGDFNSDINRYKAFNVYTILPFFGNGHNFQKSCDTLKKNIRKLENTDKIICFLDFNNPNHIRQFIELFSKKCELIDVNGGHCPHPRLEIMSLLLTPNGIATGFIFLPNTNVYSEKEFLQTIYNFEKVGWYTYIYFLKISEPKFTNIIISKQIQNYLVHLIIKYIPKQFQITLEVANDIQNNWNNYDNVIPKLQQIVTIIMNKKEDDIYPLVGTICKYRHLWGKFPIYKIEFILHHHLPQYTNSKTENLKVMEIFQNLIQ